MKSYEILRKISEGLYLNLKDEIDVEKRLTSAVQKIQKQVSEDFQGLFGQKLNLRDFQIYVDDETYRQSATALILQETIKDHEEFEIKVECLIDHGRIMIKAKPRNQASGFEDIINRIEKVQNYEGYSELKDIK